MEDITNLQNRIHQYQEVLKNTVTYRKVWNSSLRDHIQKQLQDIIDATKLKAEISLKENVENLEAIVLSLGQTRSGIFEKVNPKLQRHLIKDNGSLIYQQLFNGKIIVLINYPMIENYGEPRPPKTVAIYRPEEIKPPFLVRHLEDFIKEVTNWEDFDDDEPHQRIGFNLNFMNQVESDDDQ